MKDARGETRRSGSGFFIAPNLVATCLHVVDSPGRIVVVASADDEYERALVQLRQNSGATSAPSIVRKDEGSDLALLRVPTVKNSQTLKFTSRQDYYVGDAVYTIGNPVGLEGTFSNGIISNFARIYDVNYIVFTAPASPGSSGGALVDSQGLILGIVNSQIEKGQNLNFAVSVTHLETLIKGTQRPKAASTSRFLRRN